ncbi:hypothetical protein QL285_059623 [Trifolium repens]|nr:hypothetical protein QL285_059623 [Trifolium repens]
MSHLSNHIRCCSILPIVLLLTKIYLWKLLIPEKVKNISVSFPTRSVDLTINVLQATPAKLIQPSFSKSIKLRALESINLFFNRVSYLPFVALRVKFRIKLNQFQIQ